MFDLQAALVDARAGLGAADDLIDWAETTGSPTKVAAANAVLGVASWAAAEPSQSLGYSQRAIQLCRQIPADDPINRDEDHWGLFLWSACNTRGLALDDLGRIDSSLSAHRSALELAVTKGYNRGVVVSLANSCLQLIRSGDVTTATRELASDGPELSPRWASEWARIRREIQVVIHALAGLNELVLETVGTPWADPVSSLLSADVEQVSRWARISRLLASLAPLDTVRRWLDHLEGHAAVASPRVGIPLRLARALMLARDGRIPEGLALVESLARIGACPPQHRIDIINTRAEVLARAGNHDEALAELENSRASGGWTHGLETANLRTAILVESGRWSAAVEAGRYGEGLRQRFDLNPGRYIELALSSEVGQVREPVVVAGINRDPGRQRINDMMARDFRGQLHSVELAFRSAQLETDPVQRQSKLDRLLHLVDALRDLPTHAGFYLQLVGGTLLTKDQSVELLSCFDCVSERYRPQMVAKEIDLLVNSPGPTEVLLDPAMLDACLSSLLNNAIKFSPRGATIVLGWARTAPVGGAGPDLVEIYVDDEGPGLTAHDHTEIFQRMGLFAAEHAGNESGSGVGLQIVAGFARRMGGRVRAENKPGGGSRFALVLPASRFAVADPVTLKSDLIPRVGIDLIPRVGIEPARVSSSAAATTDDQDRAFDTGSADGDEFKVLVFDDDPMVVEVFSEIVRHVGGTPYASTTVNGIREIIKNNSEFQMMIFDVMIDGAPIGIRLARLAARLSPRGQVVIVTGLTGDFDDLPEGCVLLRKPVGYAQIEKLMEERREELRAADKRPEPAGSSEVGADTALALLNEIIHARPVFEVWIDRLADSSCVSDKVNGLILRTIYERVKGQLEASIQLAHQALDLIAESGVEPPTRLMWNLLQSLAMSLTYLGQFEKGVETADHALRWAERERFDFGVSRAALILAVAYSGDQKPELAVRALNTAFDRMAGDLTARGHLLSALGKLLFRHGALEFAVIQYRTALGYFSSLQAYSVKVVYRRLADTYIELGDYDSAGVIASRIEQMSHLVSAPFADASFVEAVRASIVLARGEPSEAIDRLEALLSQASPDTMAEVGRVAISALVDALGQLDRHEEVVRRWGALEQLPVYVRSPGLLERIARSHEQLGQYRLAFDFEQQAGRLRAQRSVGLPSLVEFMRRLNREPLSSLGVANTSADDTDHGTTLADRADVLVTMVEQLRADISQWRDEPHQLAVDGEKAEESLDSLIQAVQVFGESLR